MATPEVRSEIDAGPGRVTTAWVASRDPVAVLVVGHGAGGGMDHPFLAGFCRAIAEAGVATLRFNFLYMERGRRSPDPERVLRDVWLSAFEAGTKRSDGRPVLAGGKSLGGRIASMCTADGMPSAGLVFLGYPLHRPGKPERIRDEHLYAIRVPMMFIHGTQDPFARPDLLARVLRKLGKLAEHHQVEGGDHSFRVRGVKADDREIGAALARAAAPFVHRVAGRR